MSACAACQSAMWIEYDSSLLFAFYLMTLPLVGLNGHITAQRLCPLQREFKVVAMNPSHGVNALTGFWTHRFPNPVPKGTSVPQWALEDVTVGCYLSFLTRTDGAR
jgi:hypothetical protein